MADYVAIMTGLQAAADNPELPDDVRRLVLDARELLDTLKRANTGAGAMFEEMERGVVATVARVDETARLEERAKLGRAFGELGSAELASAFETQALANPALARRFEEASPDDDLDAMQENDEPQD